MQVLFEDIDPSQNGSYLNKDTILIHNNTEQLFLDIKLEEKQNVIIN